MELMFIDTHMAEEIVLNIGKHTEPLLSFSSSIINTYATKKISRTNPNKLYIQFIRNCGFTVFPWTVFTFATIFFKHYGFMLIKIFISICHPQG